MRLVGAVMRAYTRTGLWNTVQPSFMSWATHLNTAASTWANFLCFGLRKTRRDRDKPHLHRDVCLYNDQGTALSSLDAPSERTCLAQCVVSKLHVPLAGKSVQQVGVLLQHCIEDVLAKTPRFNKSSSRLIPNLAFLLHGGSTLLDSCTCRKIPSMHHVAVSIHRLLLKVLRHKQFKLGSIGKFYVPFDS